VLGEVVGLALRRALSCPVEINLLPPALVARRVFQRRIPFLAMASVGLILIMLVFWLFLHRMRAMAEDRLQMVESRVTALQSPANTLIELARQREVAAGKVTLLMDLTRERTKWLEILETLHSRVIEGMWVTGVRVSGENEQGKELLQIDGMGFSDKVSHPAITEFTMLLKGQGYVSDEIRIKKIRPVGGVDYVNEFTIEAVLNPKPVPVATLPAGEPK